MNFNQNFLWVDSVMLTKFYMNIVSMVVCFNQWLIIVLHCTHTAMIPKAGWNHLQSFVFFLFSRILITKNASSAGPFCHYKNPLSVHLEDRKQERI